MSPIITLEEIQELVKDIDLVAAMEEAFIQYSNGKAVIPPVGELLFEKPKGETHIKYGYLLEDDFFCIKIASGFPNNAQFGLATSQGMILLFSKKTGAVEAVLLDEGTLTNLRTAAAGALVARYFAPKKPKAIGIIGTGIQAKLQLQFLLKDYPNTSVWLWGRNRKKMEAFVQEVQAAVPIHLADTAAQVAGACDLIVTTTPTSSPLLYAKDIQAGTHLTAVGSDTADKQELEAALLAKSDLLIADSISQSKQRGEIFKALKAEQITASKIIELGTAIQNPKLQRSKEEQITIADLTGVAVQDILIAKAVFQKHQNL